MKFKTTRKAIVNGCSNVRYCGYCDLWNLLQNHEPIAYTCGVYGWNFDVYEVYGVTICTGYRGMPGERLEGVQEFDEKAREIWLNHYAPYETKRAETEKLLKEFCKLNGGFIHE